MRLVLFDIDGTMMDSGGAGTRSMDMAFEKVFSIPRAFRGISMAGKTDIQIMKEGLARQGMDSGDGYIGSLCDAYVRSLRTEISNSERHLKPGILDSIRTLSGMSGLHLGLLTGNIEAGARIKLGSFGLNPYFPFGAFGDDDEDRNKLLPVAVEKFSRLYKEEIAYKDCVVIGDTPRDVECAKIHNAYAVAVATGPYSYESLLRSGADMVLKTITEMDYSFLS